MAKDVNQPIRYNMPDNFRSSGKRPFNVFFKYASGNVVDFQGCTVTLNVFNKQGAVIFNPSTVDGGITVRPNNYIQINEIKRLKLGVGCYTYELTVTHVSGLVRVYLFGNWSITK